MTLSRGHLWSLKTFLNLATHPWLWDGGGGQARAEHGVVGVRGLWFKKGDSAGPHAT